MRSHTLFSILIILLAFSITTGQEIISDDDYQDSDWAVFVEAEHGATEIPPAFSKWWQSGCL